MSGKKLFFPTPERFGRNSSPPQKCNGHANHLGGEGRNGFDTFVNVIHQQNGWRAFMMWWFSRLEFCI